MLIRKRVKLRIILNLCEQQKLIDAEGSGGGEGVESEFDGGGAMGVPAAPVGAIGAGLVLMG